MLIALIAASLLASLLIIYVDYINEQHQALEMIKIAERQESTEYLGRAKDALRVRRASDKIAQEINDDLDELLGNK